MGVHVRTYRKTVRLAGERKRVPCRWATASTPESVTPKPRPGVWLHQMPGGVFGVTLSGVLVVAHRQDPRYLYARYTNGGAPEIRVYTQ